MTRIDGELRENGVAVKDGVNGQAEELQDIVNIAHAYDTMYAMHWLTVYTSQAEHLLARP